MTLAADPDLSPFLSPSFSPIDHLNAQFPLLPSPHDHLPQTASQVQTHISVLAAHQSRLTTALTDLTDDILRTSARLAYEIELLRGDALSLVDLFAPTGSLFSSISSFTDPTPDEMVSSNETTLSSTTVISSHKTKIAANETTLSKETKPSSSKTKSSKETEAPSEPRHDPASKVTPLRALQDLHEMRRRLTDVVQTFNSALSFVLPPSLLQSTAFISIQAPITDAKAEERGQSSIKQIRDELDQLLKIDDWQAAQTKIQTLRDFCIIWTGTAEENARCRFVDSLQHQLDQAMAKKASPAKPGLAPSNSASAGFLRRLRDEIYLE